MKAMAEAVEEVQYFYNFNVTLNGISPPIWRQILVPMKYTFFELHVAIQDSMGWKFIHPYEFCDFSSAPGENIHIKNPESPFPLSLGDAKIQQYFKSSDNTALYVYGSPAGLWEHTVTLLQNEQVSMEVAYSPICRGGKRACPPEGFYGGAENYSRHLKALSDPNDPDHAECWEYMASFGCIDRLEDFQSCTVVFTDAKELYFNTLPQLNPQF